MSSTTAEVKIGYLYEDGSTKTYSIPEVDMNDLANVKTRVQKLNAAFGGDTSDTLATAYATDMQKTFVSNGGASMVKISSAKITITEEEVIYGGN